MPQYSNNFSNNNTNSIQQIENYPYSDYPMGPSPKNTMPKRKIKQKNIKAEGPLMSKFMDSNPTYKKIMHPDNLNIPMKISGQKTNQVPTDRKVLWKNVCQIGGDKKNQKHEPSEAELWQGASSAVIGGSPTRKTQAIEGRECIVEMSRTKTKFYIVAIDMEFFKYHVLELYRPQANKILKGCDNSLMKLMTFLEFRFGTLCIKDMELLL